MEIERINENTVKFYISYVDIESRGFEREEIWYNRERSEQLFWQMMDEVNYKEDFPVEGPLWIQVQALEKGLEIIVTKAQLSSEHALESLEEVEDLIDLTLSDKSNYEASEMDQVDDDENELEMNHDVKLITSFDHFDDVIALSHYFRPKYEKDIETRLYHYQGTYYLSVEMKTSIYDEQEDLFSQILEYSKESDLTSYILEEYATVVMEADVFAKLRQYF